MANRTPEALFAPVLHSMRLTYTLYNETDSDFVVNVFNTDFPGGGSVSVQGKDGRFIGRRCPKLIKQDFERIPSQCQGYSQLIIVPDGPHAAIVYNPLHPEVRLQPAIRRIGPCDRHDIMAIM